MREPRGKVNTGSNYQRGEGGKDTSPADTVISLHNTQKRWEIYDGPSKEKIRIEDDIQMILVDYREIRKLWAAPGGRNKGSKFPFACISWDGKNAHGLGGIPDDPSNLNWLSGCKSRNCLNDDGSIACPSAKPPERGQPTCRPDAYVLVLYKRIMVPHAIENFQWGWWEAGKSQHESVALLWQSLMDGWEKGGEHPSCQLYTFTGETPKWSANVCLPKIKEQRVLTADEYDQVDEIIGKDADRLWEASVGMYKRKAMRIDPINAND